MSEFWGGFVKPLLAALIVLGLFIGFFYAIFAVGQASGEMNEVSKQCALNVCQGDAGTAIVFNGKCSCVIPVKP